MKRCLYGLYLKTKSLLNSFKHFREFHLMDDVIYNGKRYFINNGIAYPYYDLCEYEYTDGKRKSIRVHESKIKKVKSLQNLKNDLLYLHKWYMNYWYEIDLRKGMEA